MTSNTTTPSGCPSDDVVVAFVERALDGPAAAAFEEHLDTCADCSRLIATYARVYLASDAGAGAPLASSTSTHGEGEAVQRLLSARALAPGAVVGRYVVLDCVGEGASSIVYGAYDPELDRKVALKVLRATFGDGETVARATQLREARAMAKLAHANIVGVHDVGADGERVFIAMEYVDGATLRGWLAGAERSVAEIEAALLDAGRGLAAMHAAGLVHRDFKPENVLVGKDGRARLTDLGLARILHGEIAGAASERAARGGAVVEPGPPSSRSRLDPHVPGSWTNAVAGTPAYMAPEQTAGRVADARSDQYSFAVTLYEALFGERPPQGGARGSTGSLTIPSIPPRAKSSVRPAAPARRVSKRTRAALAKALATRPEDRFGSLKELLRALEPSGGGRKRLYLGVVAAAALTVAAVAALRVTNARAAVCTQAATEMKGVWDADQKRAIAAAFRGTRLPYAEAAWTSVERAGDAYAAAWVAARTEACVATRVRGEQSDAVLTVRMECLDRRRRELAAVTTLFKQADAAVVEHAVAALDRVAPIAACNDEAALLASVRPPEAPAVRKQVDALRDELDRVRTLGESGKAAAALPDAKKDVATAKALGYRPTEAEALFLLGSIEEKTADFAAAVPTLYDAVSAAEAGRHDELAAEVWATLVEILALLDRFDEAKRAADRAQAAIERTSGAGRAPLILPDALGSMYRELGRYPEAVKQHQAAIALEEKALGADHLEVAKSLRNLGNALRDNGDTEAALAAYTRALGIQEKLLGAEHPDVANTLQSLAILYVRLGRYAEAMPRYERLLTMREQMLGPNHPSVGETLGSLVVAMRWSGDAAKALPLAKRALEIETAAYGAEHDVTAGAENNVGFIELALHHYAEARASFERALAVRERLLGPASPKVAMELENLGQTALAEKRFEDARSLYERGLAIDEKGLKPDHPDLAYALVGLGLADLGLGKAEEAVPLLEKALRLRGSGKVQPRAIAEARFALARALWEGGGDRARAVSLATQGKEGYAGAGRAFAQEVAEISAWLGSR